VDHSITPQVYELANGSHSSPVILILGDSFTIYFAPMIAASGGRAIWLQHQICGFDWQWIEKFKPDQVWYMPTERYFPCGANRRPAGLPERGLVAHEAPVGFRR
jgi:hypothetical protein